MAQWPNDLTMGYRYTNYHMNITGVYLGDKSTLGRRKGDASVNNRSSFTVAVVYIVIVVYEHAIWCYFKKLRRSFSITSSDEQNVDQNQPTGGS